MKRVILMILLVSVLVIPVSAAEIEAPEVPESGQEYLQDRPDSFSEGLLSIVKEAVAALHPNLAQAGSICIAVFAVALLLSVFGSFDGKGKKMTALIGTLATAMLLLGSTNTLIGQGKEAVTQISEYGKLLLPVMTAGLAAQGAAATSAALYAATAFFDTILTMAISKLLMPLVYVYLALAIANAATGDELLKKLRNLVKWLVTWALKTILTIFTGYIGITGVVSGATDASALKVTKAAISNAVPVVGSILSNASEAVLVGAGMMKNAAGVYGMLAVIAVLIGPFLEIGVEYLLLKLTAAVSALFGPKHTAGLIQDFSDAMGLLLAMTCSCAFLQVISVICFMKGVS